MSTLEHRRHRARLLTDILATDLEHQLHTAALVIDEKNTELVTLRAEVKHLRMMFDQARDVESLCRRLCRELGRSMPLAVAWVGPRPEAYPGPYTFWQAQEIASRGNEADGSGWSVERCVFGGWQPVKDEQHG